MTAKRTPRILIIGAGGIGGMVAELVIPALNKIEKNCLIEMMDGDIVEESNLGHQRFSHKDVGKRKTDVLSNRFSGFKFVNVKSNPVNLRVEEQLDGYDFIIIGVDRPHPRRLVHATNVPWIDLRSTGDGHVYFTNESDPALVAMMTPDHEPASCQIEGAIDAGNIQFGYVNAAAAAATWLIGQLRNQPTLRERMSSIMFGELKFPEVRA